MGCNCEGKTINVGMGCCVPILGPVENYYTKQQVDKLISAVTVSAVSEAWVEDYAYDKATVEEKVDTLNTKIERVNNRFDNYYTTAETSSSTEIADALAEKLAVSDFQTYSGTVASELSVKASQSTVDTLSGQIQSISSSTSGDVTVISGDVITISGDVTSLSNDLSEHTANTTVHITSTERNTWNAKADVWVGDETAWSQISGNTQQGVIYLVF